MKKGNKKIKGKKVTIDQLAVMVSKGFFSMEKRIDGVEEKFENRFTGLDSKMEGLDKRMDRQETGTKFGFSEVNEKLTSVEQRLGKVEDALQPIIMTQKFTTIEIRKLNIRVTKIEHKISI